MKTMIKICILIFILFILFYAVCFFDTNSITRDFKKTISEQTFTNTALDAYIGSYNEEKGPVKNSKIKINRRFVIHNFNKGVMYVKYSYEHYNDKGIIIGGSWNISSKWFIEKKLGQWIVTRIEEKP